MRRARSDATRQFYVAVGQKISQVRQEKHVTQEALAADIAVTRTSIVNIERGKQQILLHTLVKIAHALRVLPGELLPEVAPDDPQLALQAISNVIDPKGRSWMQRSAKTETKGS